MSENYDLATEVKKTHMAARALSIATSETKNAALAEIAKLLREKQNEIIKANALDLDAAGELPPAMLDRLTLTPERIEAMAIGTEKIIELPDPVGELLLERVRPNGLKLQKVRVPIGVIAIIYESRPNVTVDAAALCLKSGNATVLRGGKESFNSNICLGEIISEALTRAGFDGNTVTVVGSTNRALVGEMLTMSESIDAVIPRGGKGLIKRVVEESRIPVIKHYEGICHVYVDSDANLKMAEDIALNAKTSRPGVCNAMETLLVHEDVAPEILPTLTTRMMDASVELRGCDAACKIAPQMKPATDADWAAEYLELILAVRVVSSLEMAIDHIAKYSSGHTESIVTSNQDAAREFQQRVDSACVFHNASTRFSDGFEFGMGAEIGISTDKLHARGPMGLEELTTYKWLAYGEGQVRT